MSGWNITTEQRATSSGTDSQRTPDRMHFFATRKALPEHAWINKPFNQGNLSAADRMALLSGLPPKGAAAGARLSAPASMLGGCDPPGRQNAKPQTRRSDWCLPSGWHQLRRFLPELKFIS